MATIYYIYEIPGVKIGTSKAPHIRVKEQGYDHYIVLEEHMSKTRASKRETELQRELGYRVDPVPYVITDGAPTDEGRIKGGQKVQTYKWKCPHCGLETNPGALGNHIRWKHPA